MAYIKYKELTQYFDFYKELDISNLPSYVTEYIDSEEHVLVGYGTLRDKFILTDKKIILFDVRGISGKHKRIHFFPVISISSCAIDFNTKRLSLFLSFDSGYQLRLNFINMTPFDKNKIKIFFTQIVNSKCLQKIN